MPPGMKHMLDRSWEDRPIDQIVDAPVAALQGVGNVGAEHLDKGLGAETIGEIVSSRAVRYATAIVRASDERFDPGPPPHWANALLDNPLPLYLSEGPTFSDGASRFRHDFGAVYYRGRLDGTARVLIVGQDPAANELVGRRAFVGDAGQKLQRVLEKLGLTRSYLMLNTFLYAIYGQFDSDMEAFSSRSEMVDYRNKLFDLALSEGGLDAVLTFGRAAKHAVSLWQPANKPPVFNFTHPSSPGTQSLLENWNTNLAAAAPHITPDDPARVDLTPYGTDWTDADEIDIPRYDLPFGTPDWHGRGSHARRGRLDGGGTNPKEIIWTAS